ncbi:MAG: zinc-dependent alcohol dehydrogenase family protein [Myxococcaceae bacterium]|nr:zinc-dependent alcohol dehydrogenase family protein [Myxococcaceae bacterium]MCI0671657.1 zinc-dependent alcohol dehydrogenase family protein [Myxococcaceae bacterium]
MRAVQLTAYGPPVEVVQLVELPEPTLAEGEALVEVLATPINPSDVSMIEGRYGIRPELPAVPGFEGVGRVVEVRGKSALTPGTRVLLPSKGGTWRTHLKARADALVPVPEGANTLQMAMHSINPPTAELLLRMVPLQKGDWVLQNGANSGVGRALITLARRKGLRTLNVVRREELVPELLHLGADVVLVDDEDLPMRVRQATASGAVRLGVDCVGGGAAMRLADALSEGGTLVSYGAMSGKGPMLTPQALIFRDITVRGFWLTRWFATAASPEKRELYAGLATLIADGTLHSPVDSTYPLERVKEALTRAMEGGRHGKVLLTPNGPV